MLCTFIAKPIIKFHREKSQWGDITPNILPAHATGRSSSNYYVFVLLAAAGKRAVQIYLILQIYAYYTVSRDFRGTHFHPFFSILICKHSV